MCLFLCQNLCSCSYLTLQNFPHSFDMPDSSVVSTPNIALNLQDKSRIYFEIKKRKQTALKKKSYSRELLVSGFGLGLQGRMSLIATFPRQITHCSS